MHLAGEEGERSAAGWTRRRIARRDEERKMRGPGGEVRRPRAKEAPGGKRNLSLGEEGGA